MLHVTIPKLLGTAKLLVSAKARRTALLVCSAPCVRTSSGCSKIILVFEHVPGARACSGRSHMFPPLNTTPTSPFIEIFIWLICLSLYSYIYIYIYIHIYIYYILMYSYLLVIQKGFKLSQFLLQVLISKTSRCRQAPR